MSSLRHKSVTATVQFFLLFFDEIDKKLYSAVIKLVSRIKSSAYVFKYILNMISKDNCR